MSQKACTHWTAGCARGCETSCVTSTNCQAAGSPIHEDGSLTGKPDAGNPPVRFGGREGRKQSATLPRYEVASNSRRLFEVALQSTPLHPQSRKRRICKRTVLNIE